MNNAQILGILLVIAALGFKFYKQMAPVSKLSEDEKVLLASWEGKIDKKGAQQLSSNLEAACNYFIIDSESENPVYDSPDDLKWAKFNQARLTNGVGINLSKDYPQFVKEFYELYDEQLGDDFTLRELVDLNRKTARVLREIK